MATLVEVSDEQLQDNFHETCAWLRREAPLARNPENGTWVLTRYEDVLAVFGTRTRSPRTSASAP